jgi:hypothetical protein
LTALGKLDDRYQQGVFLGYGDKNSTFLFGRWVEDLRTKQGIRFAVEENKKCRFDESVLISNIEHLKPDHQGTYVPYPSPSSLCDEEFECDDDLVPAGSSSPAGGAGVADPEPSSKVTSEAADCEKDVPPAKRRKIIDQNFEFSEGVYPPDDGIFPSTDFDPNAPAFADAERNKVPRLRRDNNVPSQPPAAYGQKKQARELPTGDVQASGGDNGGAGDAVQLSSDDHQRPDPAVFVDGEFLKKKRGRPRGSKNKPGSKKPGPKPRHKSVGGQAGRNNSRRNKRRSKTAKGRFVTPPPDPFLDNPSVSEGDYEKLFMAYNYVVSKQVAQKKLSKRLKKVLDEEAISYTVCVTRKEAYNGPDSVKWTEAADKERTSLEAFKCWRPIEPGELQPGDEVIPSVIIFTRKRCGRFKARLVALGNRQSAECSGEIYAPTVSHPGNRFILTKAASEAMFIGQFDISNAFISAHLGDEKVIVRLPPEWSCDPKGDRVRLLKSLYGLRIAPRRWYDCYRKKLEAFGWKASDREPGIFTKKVNNTVLWMSVDVDDSFIACTDRVLMEKGMKLILSDQGFPGKIIEPEFAKDDLLKETEIRDVLGATLYYNRKARKMDFLMDSAIDRMLAKYKMTGCKQVSVPCVHEADLFSGPKNTSFPLRSMVGALLYIAMIARPDVAFAVQRVARCVSEPTEAAVEAAKRIARYLAGTKHLGIHYTPEKEAEFNELYQNVASEQKKELGEWAAFTDSDFAGDSVTLKSTSGGILYFKGTPIAWSAKMQQIRALSTCEAEYVAAFDAIKMCRSQGYLDLFFEEDGFPLLFCDNQSAIALSKNNIVTKRSKHMHLRYHTVKDYVKSLCFCPSLLNRADPFTKPLPSKRYLEVFYLHADTEEAVSLMATTGDFAEADVDWKEDMPLAFVFCGGGEACVGAKCGVECGFCGF